MLSGLAIRPVMAQTQTEMSSYFSGNAAARPETIEKIVRMSVAQVLSGQFAGVNLSFNTAKINQGIALPSPNENLRDILKVLGIQQNVNIAMTPVHASFTLPESALKITIKKLQPNRFQVKAKWAITKLNASSSQLALKVPKGAFDRAFDIVSSPVQMGLTAKSKPITIELNMITNLTDTGTRIQLVDFKTNLNDRSAKKPEFFIKLGQLTVEGKPLELEIQSNGQRLIADEAAIRAEFQTLEQGLMQTICDRLQNVVEQRFNVIAANVEKSKPIRITLDSDAWNEELADKPDVKKLLQNVSIDFFISYLQYVDRYKIFSTQVSSTVCIDKGCLLDMSKPSLVNIDDFKGVDTHDEVAILIYESWIQNFVHSPEFQKRILTFVTDSKLKGIVIGKQGVRVHLNPIKNSIAVVLNLEVDIKKTGKEGTSFGKKFRRSLGDMIEKVAGSGKVVKIPVEINAIFQKIKKDATGQSVLKLAVEMPFKDGKVTNTYNYPSNVAEMTGMVRDEFLESMKEELAEVIPAELSIPLGHSVKIKDYSFNIRKAYVTPNRGLLVTGEMTNQRGNYE